MFYIFFTYVFHSLFIFFTYSLRIFYIFLTYALHVLYIFSTFLTYYSHIRYIYYFHINFIRISYTYFSYISSQAKRTFYIRFQIMITQHLYFHIYLNKFTLNMISINYYATHFSRFLHCFQRNTWVFCVFPINPTQELCFHYVFNRSSRNTNAFNMCSIHSNATTLFLKCF